MARKRKAVQKKNTKSSKSPSKNKVEKVEKEIEEEEVDYGATADEFFGVANDNKDDEEGKEDDEEEQDSGSSDSDDSESNDEPNKQDEENQKENDSAEDDDDDDEDGNNNVVVEEEEDDNQEEEEDEDDEDDQQMRNLSTMPPVHTNAGEEACSFDLRNLTAVNSHPHPETALYKKKKTNNNKSEKLTIQSLPHDQVLNEDYLLQKATEGCTQLIHALWQLPTEKSDAGPLMTLPTYSVLDIPRALPPPPPKVDTKWEKFAKERGIAINKEKRSRKVWDDATNSWKFRHGYDKANATTRSGDDGANKWPIMEVGGNDDPYADPWETARDAKHQRTEHNRERYMKNQERAGILPKGTTRRVLKSREQTRQVGKAGGRIDTTNNALLPVGVPVDMNSKVLRGQSSTMAALKATQVSTASLGKFDKLREGEPERKFPLASKKKRKLLMTDEEVSGGTSGNNNKKNKRGGAGGGGEQERGLKVLQTVLQGGGVEKEKARKKGKLAKGVTAYDYEYDDGADNALFKKKKGRGGVGKNRKMTKKRIK